MGSMEMNEHIVRCGERGSLRIVYVTFQFFECKLKCDRPHERASALANALIFRNLIAQRRKKTERRQRLSDKYSLFSRASCRAQRKRYRNRYTAPSVFLD